MQFLEEYYCALYIFQCCMATIMMLIGNLDILMGYVNFVVWFTHGISVVGLIWIRIRKIPVDNRAMRVRGPVITSLDFKNFRRTRDILNKNWRLKVQTQV